MTSALDKPEIYGVYDPRGFFIGAERLERSGGCERCGSEQEADAIVRSSKGREYGVCRECLPYFVRQVWPHSCSTPSGGWFGACKQLPEERHVDTRREW